MEKFLQRDRRISSSKGNNLIESLDTRKGSFRMRPTNIIIKDRAGNLSFEVILTLVRTKVSSDIKSRVVPRTMYNPLISYSDLFIVNFHVWPHSYVGSYFEDVLWCTFYYSGLDSVTDTLCPP